MPLPERQIMTNWCWAASTVVISKYYNPAGNLNQRQVVAKLLNKPPCALPMPNPICNVKQDFSVSLNTYGYLAQAVNTTVSQDDLINSIKNKRLVGCQMDFSDMGGHAIVITNIINSQSQVYLEIADPAVDSLFNISYQQFRDNYRGLGGQWARTYFTKPNSNQI